MLSIAPLPHTTAQPLTTRAAQDLESAFLAEMLKAAGFGQTPESLGGGTPFDSFMADTVARAIVARGGLGLASRIDASLQRAP